MSACRAELEKHADLSQYSTWNAAADVELVRAALGYDQIDLMAVSYAKLAQIYMKRFPESVRSAVLVGIAPPDFRAPLFHAANAQRALDLLFYAASPMSRVARPIPICARTGAGCWRGSTHDRFG